MTDDDRTGKGIVPVGVRGEVGREKGEEMK